ncbi:MAG TPA: hypothetical protein VE977_12905 [Pyrinomonadaceae bacterium]|nr:hypothetical protein [Pyrinomonadaceae bacterium]
MEEHEKDADLDLVIEVIEGREELLVAAAGTCTGGHRGPQVQIIAAPE